MKKFFSIFIGDGSRSVIENAVSEGVSKIKEVSDSSGPPITPLTLVMLGLLFVVPLILLRRVVQFKREEDESIEMMNIAGSAGYDFERNFKDHIKYSPLPYRNLVLDPRNKRLSYSFGVAKTLSNTSAKFPALEKVFGTFNFLWDLLITMSTFCLNKHHTDYNAATDNDDKCATKNNLPTTPTPVERSFYEKPKENRIDREVIENRNQLSVTDSPRIEVKPRSNTGQFFFDSLDDENDVNLGTQIDENGYLFLGQDDNNITPVLIFINTTSGPQQGAILLSQLQQLVNPIQIHDMAKGPPHKSLKSYIRRFGDNLRILVCGGDGTICWIMNSLDEVKKELNTDISPPIGILPLGTGNDLARILGWGGGWGGSSDSILEILCRIATAKKTSLDRWKLEICKPKGKEKDCINFTNYFGVGVDAGTTLQVHNLRKSRPRLFSVSRFINQFFYVLLGSPQVVYNSYCLTEMIELYCDGKVVDIPDDCQGIIFLNIDSYAGGVPLWSRALHPKKIIMTEMTNRSSVSTWPRLNGLSNNISSLLQKMKYDECSYNDGLIDVCYVRGVYHLGQIKVGLSDSKLLTQAKTVRIKVKKPLPIQTDGEPHLLKNKCELFIERSDQACMLESPRRKPLASPHTLRSTISTPSFGLVNEQTQNFENHYASGESGDDYLEALSSALSQTVISQDAYEYIIRNVEQQRLKRRVHLDEMRRFSFT